MTEYLRASEYISTHKKMAKEDQVQKSTSVANAIKLFQDKYNLDHLEAISNRDLYDKLFKYESGSMIYELRRTDSILGECGHTSQYKNNYPFYEKSGKIFVGKCIPGYENKAITFNEASKISYLLCQDLIECIRFIQQNPLQTINDYRSFENHAEKLLKSLHRYTWIHKFFHLLFPAYFTQIHTAKYRSNLLIALRLEPEKSVFLSDYHLGQIQTLAGIGDPFVFAHTLYDIPELYKSMIASSPKPLIPKELVVKGVFGSWEIKNEKIALLKCATPLFAEKTFVIPKELMFFFEDPSEKCTIDISIEGEIFHADLENGSAEKILCFPENLHSFLKKTAIENCCDIILSFSPKGGNAYSARMIQIPAKEKTPSTDEKQETRTEMLSQLDLSKIAEEHTQKKPKKLESETIQYYRDPYIAEYAKRRANGICQLCKQAAPFLDKNGKPYLESHHIVYLSNGGEDSIENTVALCPNCHRRVHILERPEDVWTLKMANEAKK